MWYLKNVSSWGKAVGASTFGNTDIKVIPGVILLTYNFSKIQEEEMMYNTQKGLSIISTFISVNQNINKACHWVTVFQQLPLHCN